MTTPNQPPPDSATNRAGSGAYQVGGGGLGFGQGVDEATVTSLFMLPSPTEDNKEAVFAQALTMLPSTALSSLAPVVPDWVEGDEYDPDTVVVKVFDNLFPKPTVQNTWDDIVNNLFGWLGSGWTRGDSQQAIADTAAAMASLAAQVQALQNTQTAAGNSGNSAVVDFSTRANASSIGSDFTQVYSGPGTHTWGITDGRVTIQGAEANNDRQAVAVYNVEQTLTDYQKVGAAFASRPIFDTANLILGRVNAAGTSYVYAWMDKTEVELGCVVAGVRTVFTSTTVFSFKSTAVYWLVTGTVGGSRVFQVLEGDSPVLTHTEVGTTSQLGASYRYTGIGIDVDASAFGTSEPGRVAAFGMSDNTPPTFLGSGAYIYRTSTSTIGLTSGQNLLPTSFFGATGDNTTDITVDLTNGKFTVSITGWYTIGARCRTANSFLPNGVTWVLYKNGSAYRYAGTEHTRGVNSSNVAYIPQGWHAVWNGIYLVAGDYVQAGYDATSSVSNVMSGEASGNQTYFSITLANKSLN